MLQNPTAALVGANDFVGTLVSRGGHNKERAKLQEKGVDLGKSTAYVKVLYNSENARVRVNTGV